MGSKSGSKLGSKSDVKGWEEQENLLVFRQMLQGRGGKLALAVSAVGVLLLAGAEYNQAAACRGAGVTTSTSNGTSLTKWSDGASVRTEKDGSFEWSYPSGSDPVPGASPGHKPY